MALPPVYEFACSSLALPCTWSVRAFEPDEAIRSARRHLREAHPDRSLPQSGAWGPMLRLAEPPLQHCAFETGGLDSQGEVALCGKSLPRTPVVLPQVPDLTKLDPAWEHLPYGNERMRRALCLDHQLELIWRYLKFYLPMRDLRVRIAPKLIHPSSGN
jgi:predicted small metal-binding protein